ncbi:MAG: HAD family hydrolase [Candidatus Lokiarchaeota archaeon]|nr:HAD family hydrolase [Candidatus Lokiarchaeota archaeon]
MIKAITFDLWNTLFENISYSDIRLKLISNKIEFKNKNLSSDNIKESYESNFLFLNPEEKVNKIHHVFTEKRFINLLSDINVKMSNTEIIEIVKKLEDMMLNNPPPLKPNVKKTLESLAPKYKIGLISDTGITPGRVLKQALEHHEILQFFDTLIFSDEIGVYKPHPLPFQTALKNLAVPAELSIHIGDLIDTDIVGAKNFNMSAIWVNNEPNIELLKIKPDYIIKDIYEAVGIIAQLQ